MMIVTRYRILRVSQTGGETDRCVRARRVLPNSTANNILFCGRNPLRRNTEGGNVAVEEGGRSRAHVKHASAARQSNEAVFAQFLSSKFAHQSIFVVSPPLLGVKAGVKTCRAPSSILSVMAEGGV